MNLKSIVPPLELCKLIPEGKFAESVLVWEVYKYQYSVDPYVMSRETSETTRTDAVNSIFPAPTLEEIMLELPIETLVYRDSEKIWIVVCGLGKFRMVIEKADSGLTAALKMWLKINNIEVSK